MVNKLTKMGLGVGATIELKADYVNQFSGETLRRKGETGTVTDHFGTRPVVRFDKEGKYGRAPQVVEDISIIKVVGKSKQKAVQMKTSLEAIEEALKYASFDMHRDGDKIELSKTQSHYGEYGYHEGYYEIRAKGTVRDQGLVEITSSKILVGDIPKRDRPTLREHFESMPLEDHFGLDSAMDRVTKRKAGKDKAIKRI